MSPRWGSNTKYVRVYKNFAPLGLEYKNAILPFSSKGAAFL